MTQRWIASVPRSTALAAVLESHFTYEERKLVGALSRLRGDVDPDDFLGIALDH
jgi:hypothetical protein